MCDDPSDEGCLRNWPLSGAGCLTRLSLHYTEDLYVRGYMRPLQNEAPHSDCASRHQPTVEKLFDVHRELDVSELEHCLLGLDVDRQRVEHWVKPFQTYHVIPSQGYIVYSVKNKLKKEYLGTPIGENEGVEIVRCPGVWIHKEQIPLMHSHNAAVLFIRILLLVCGKHF
jgi:hypothetical protein